MVSISTCGVDAGGSGVSGGVTGTGSIAIGQENGQIVILSNVSYYLKWHHRQQLAQPNKGADQEGAAALIEEKSNLIRSIYHWHAHPVFAVTYAGAGTTYNPANNNSQQTDNSELATTTYPTFPSHGQINPRILYSGGEESVLVIWQLSKNTKNFLPRLGAAIVQIIALKEEVTNSGKVMVITADNTIRLVNTAK